MTEVEGARRWRAFVIALVVAATWLTLAQPAQAGTLSRDANGVVVFTASVGETNNIDVFQYTLENRTAIGDLNNTIVAAPGSGCTAWFASYWQCGSFSSQPNGFRIVLGDGNDVSQVNKWGTDNGGANCAPACIAPNIPMTIMGDAGNDNLTAGPANDRLRGGDGADVMRGGAGFNFLAGQAGNDNLAAGVDPDIFAGGIGNDTIVSADASADDVYCGLGVDAATTDALDSREFCEPNTSITQKPPARTASRTATFKYASPTPGVTFQCKLDAGAWAACSTAGKTYSRLSRGLHTFRVRARDTDGTLDPTPAAYSWRVT